MARPKILPSDQDLLRLVKEEGLTHAQIAEQVYAETGHKVARSSVSVALSRAGLAAERRRFNHEIPWTLRGKDLRAYPIRMLRLLGHRRAGDDLTAEENRRLDSWLDLMKREKAVVAWDPDCEPSVFYIDAAPGDGKHGIPIRRQRVFVRGN
jgi:hypothetical protein